MAFSVLYHTGMHGHTDKQSEKEKKRVTYKYKCQLGGVVLEWFRSYVVGRRQQVQSDQLFILDSSCYHVRCAAGVSTGPYSLFAVHRRSAVTD